MMNKKVFIIIISLVWLTIIVLMIHSNRKESVENEDVIKEPIIIEEEPLELEPSMEEMELYIDPVTGKNVDPKTGKEISLE